MAPPTPTTPPPGPLGGTSLVDRVNVGMHIRRYLKILGRRWILFTLCVLGGAGMMAYKAYNTPDMSRAISIISVAPRLRTYSTQMEYQEALDNFYDENLNLIKGVVRERSEARMARDFPLTPSALRIVEATKMASSFRLSVDSPSLLTAKIYLTNWAREFIAYKNEIKDNTVAREEARTQDQITAAQKRLEEVRIAKASFLRTNNIGSPQETGLAAQKRYDEAVDRLQQIQTTLKLERQRTPKDIAEGATTVARPAPQKEEAPKTGGEQEVDPLARFATQSKYGDMKLRLRGEESDRDRLLLTLKPAHPYLKTVATRIEQYQRQMEHQLDLIKEQRDAHLKSLESQEQSFLGLKEELLKDVQAKRTIQYEFESLMKEEDQIEKHLEGLQKAMFAFDKSSIDQSQFSIVQEGIQQMSPYSPDRKKIILQGLFFGLVAGIGLVYFLHRLDDRLEIAGDIEEALEEPVLGQIPQIDGAGKGKPILVTNLDQYSFFAEAIRGVRSAVLLGTQGTKKQILLVSSAVPGDGKTTFTVNFAATLALAGHRVLLIDADLRRGNTHNYFQQPREPGLSELLAGEMHWHDVLNESQMKSLNVINSGRLPANPGELLLSPILKQFLAEAREQYDFVVIDCPPLTAIDDAFSMLNLADGLLFVVRAGQTSMRFAKTALAAARQRGCNILGIVLNGITADNPYYYYNTYYHSYYNKAAVADGSPKLSSATPGARMAERKGRAHPASIAGEAQNVASLEDEQTKAERYRQLKARKRGAEAPENSNGSENPPA